MFGAAARCLSAFRGAAFRGAAFSGGPTTNECRNDFAGRRDVARCLLQAE